MLSPSGESPVGDFFDILDRADGMGGLRDALRILAEERGEYSGFPMPLDGERLVIHPSYSFAAGLGLRFGAEHDDSGDDDGWRIRNRFWSFAKRGDVIIMEKDGHVTWGVDHGFNHIGYDLRTLGCADAWGLKQEAKALMLLASHLKPRQLRQYLLTGMFLETSQRSGVTYIFRRLKPTVACKASKDDQMRVLAVLCMHPLAHYAGSWAGAMCPTDDVVAQLTLMRGDEHMFWRRSNQHAAYRPEAGL
jgi:hypothetical protein